MLFRKNKARKHCCSIVEGSGTAGELQFNESKYYYCRRRDTRVGK